MLHSSHQTATYLLQGICTGVGTYLMCKIKLLMLLPNALTIPEFFDINWQYRQ